MERLARKLTRRFGVRDLKSKRGALSKDAPLLPISELKEIFLYFVSCLDFDTKGVGKMNRVFGIFSYVITAVVALEQALPQTGLGSTKKAIILNGIDTVAKAGATLGSALNQPEVTAISLFIDSTVAALNASGIFKSAAK